MNRSDYKEAVIYSYKMFFTFFRKTYFQSQKSQARLTLKRFVIMSLFFPLLFFLNTLHWMGFLLDELFFPDYRKKKIRQPVFIVGIPRSGTSYLHRLLARDIQRFTTLSLWQMVIAPSVTERKAWHFFACVDDLLGSPAFRMRQFLERHTRKGLDNIHTVGLDDPEEDYFLLVPLFACYLMVLPFPFPEEMDYLAFFDDQASKRQKNRIMRFYQSCIQRHLYAERTDKQFLSKNVSFAPMVETINEVFPTCRIVCNVRHPLRSIPSHISSMTAGAKLFDNDVRGFEFRDQLMRLHCYAFRHVAEFLPQLPQNRHLYVKMEEFKKDIDWQVKKIYDHFGFPLPMHIAAYLQQEKKAARTYTSGHSYTLSAFNLNAESITQSLYTEMKRFGYTDLEGSAATENGARSDMASCAAK